MGSIARHLFCLFVYILECTFCFEKHTKLSQCDMVWLNHCEAHFFFNKHINSIFVIHFLYYNQTATEFLATNTISIENWSFKHGSLNYK